MYEDLSESIRQDKKEFRKGHVGDLVVRRLKREKKRQGAGYEDEDEPREGPYQDLEY